MNAVDLIAKLEALPLGEPWAALHTEATAAIDKQRAAALAIVFPAEFGTISADTIATYQWTIQRFGPRNYGAQLAQVHARALGSNVDLCRLLRSREALEDVAHAAALVAMPEHLGQTHAQAGAIAAAAAVASYQLAIVRSLVETDGALGDAARTAMDCEALLERAAAAEKRHREHAAAELERMRAEQAAADAALATERRRNIAEAEREAAAAKQAAHLADQRARGARVAAIKADLRARLDRSPLKHQLDLVTSNGSVYSVQGLLSSLGPSTPESFVRTVEAAIAEGRIRQGRDYSYGGSW